MNNTCKIKTLVFLVCLLFLLIVAAYQIFLSTTWGAGLSPDSVNYLRGARNILKNGNLNGLGSHWPPFYYILIVCSELITNDILVAIRWLQIVTLVLNLACFSLILWKASSRSLISSLIGGLLFVTAPSILYIHAMAWSEGSFCLLALLGMYFLARYIENKNSLTLLSLSSLFIGLAFITRYVGITLIVTGLIALFFLAANNRVKRIFSCCFFGFFSSLPMLIWISRNWYINNETTNRTFVIHPISMENVQQGIRVLLNWLHIPADYPSLLLVVLGVIAIVYVVTIKQATITQSNKLLEISIIFICIYISFLLLSISFFDAHTPLDNRILIPIYVFFNLGILLLIQRCTYIKWIKEFGYFVLILLTSLIFTQCKVQQKFIEHAKNDGLNFASKEWVESDTLQWLKKIPHGTIIYTNGPEPIEIYTNCVSKMLPRHTETGSRLRNDNIIRDINIMVTEISNHQGLIVFFKNIRWRWYLPTISQLSQVLPLEVVYEGKDSTVLRLLEKSNKIEDNKDSTSS